MSKSAPILRSPVNLSLAILIAGALGMTALLALLPDAGHDQQWLLLAATRMSGLNPYGPTVFESNPPLAIWLSALVVHLAAFLHLSLTVTFKLAVTLLATAIAFICAHLLIGRHPERSEGPPHFALALALTPTHLLFLLFAFILLFGAIPARDFGQRDHILTLLILPYLLTASKNLGVPHVSLLRRGLYTLVAALGLALKPHQALIPLAVELTVWLRPLRMRRPRLLEPTLFLLAALAYYAAVRIFAPTYLTEILPILRQTYWAFGHLTVPQLITASIQLHLLALLTLILFVRTRPRSPSVPSLLAAAAVAATLAFYLQGTGWYYQQLPALTLFALALALILTQNSELKTHNSQIKPWLVLPVALLAALTLALTTYFSDFHRTPRGRFPENLQQPQPTPDPAFFANLPENAPVATLTTSVDDTVPPAFHYHLTLAQRYPHLWMLPAILRNESGPTPRHPIPPAQLEDLDRLQHRFMIEDLRRWRPVLILVERCHDPAVHCQVLEDRHDDLLAFFLRDPAFAQIFSNYRLSKSSGPYDAYTLK